MYLPGRVGFHNFTIGMHCKAYAMTKAALEHETTAILAQATRRNVRTAKTRMYKSRSEMRLQLDPIIK